MRVCALWRRRGVQACQSLRFTPPRYHSCILGCYCAMMADVVEVLMVAKAGTADEAVVVKTNGPTSVFVEALVSGFDTTHSEEEEDGVTDGDVAFMGGSGRIGTPAKNAGNASSSYTILVKGNGFVTRQEELFHEANLRLSGQPAPSVTRGYACSLCFLGDAGSGDRRASGAAGLCPSTALQIDAQVINSTLISCHIVSSADLVPPPSAAPHLRLSVTRIDQPRHALGSGGGTRIGGGWGEHTGSLVSSCPTHLQNVGVGGGQGGRRCLHGGFPMDVSLALVGHVTAISSLPPFLPSSLAFLLPSSLPPFFPLASPFLLSSPLSFPLLPPAPLTPSLLPHTHTHARTHTQSNDTTYRGRDGSYSARQRFF